MARPLRIEYPGAIYRVTSRGNAKQNIFTDDRDRKGFLGLATKTLEPKPEEDGESETLQR